MKFKTETIRNEIEENNMPGRDVVLELCDEVDHLRAKVTKLEAIVMQYKRYVDRYEWKLIEEVLKTN